MKEKIWKIVITALLFTALFGLPFSMIAFGSELNTRQSTLYPYQSMITLQDDFLSGTTSTGNVGSLGWSFSGGTVSYVNGTTNRYGIIERSTGAVSGTVSPVLLSSASTQVGGNWSILHVIALGTNDANTTIRIGAGNSMFTSPVVHGVYFEKLDADTNWFCVTRAGGVETRTDSGVAVDTNFHNFFIKKTGTTSSEFRLDEVLVCTNTTNVPGTFLNPGSHIVNSAASAKTYQIDYFQIIITGISRP